METEMPGLDPFKIAEIVISQVTRSRDGIEDRRYYRFRGGRWYGGIATGDVVGCNLRCKFCWSWRYSYYSDKGQFYPPNTVFEKLVGIASRCKYKYIRLSGGEPTLGFNHLLSLLELIGETRYIFILETNGLLLGKYPYLAEKLSNFQNMVIRVSFKGCIPEEFEMLSGADRSFYQYQFDALANLLEYGFKPCEEFYPAVMLSFSEPEAYSNYKRRLAKIHPSLAECIDEEYVILYPHVKYLLRMNNLRPRIAYSPEGVPDFMI
ncbi:MAG: radical SAM protein [Desulfurococcaceae archaeon]